MRSLLPGSGVTERSPEEILTPPSRESGRNPTVRTAVLIYPPQADLVQQGVGAVGAGDCEAPRLNAGALDGQAEAWKSDNTRVILLV